ncbi:MAG: hypothetical protein ABSF51_02220 [Verrucomicrobiota bacterium]|jgi:hypothetical protein
MTEDDKKALLEKRVQEMRKKRDAAWEKGESWPPQPEQNQDIPVFTWILTIVVVVNVIMVIVAFVKFVLFWDFH